MPEIRQGEYPERQPRNNSDWENRVAVQDPATDQNATDKQSNAENEEHPTEREYRIITLILSTCLVIVGGIYSYFAYQQWQATSAALQTGERAWEG